MTASTIIASTLSAQSMMTVNEIADATGYSASRVREVLASMDDVANDGAIKGRRFFLKAAAVEVAPVVEEDAAEEEVKDSENTCPKCGAHHDQTPAGPEGTFLGDACNFCNHCSTTYNIFTKEEVKVGSSSGKAGKRIVLNPQNKINAKTAAVEAAGGTLTYSKVTRLWTLSMPGKDAVTMDARQFSILTPATII